MSNGLQIGSKLLPKSVLELHTQTRKPAEEEEEEEGESGLDAQSARFGASVASEASPLFHTIRTRLQSNLGTSPSILNKIRRPNVGVSEHLLKGGLPPYPEGHLGRDPKISFSIDI